VPSFDEITRATGKTEENPESNRTVSSFIFGNLTENSITLGQGAGLIKDIPTCRELIEKIMREADLVFTRLGKMFD
jgi:NAD(P)H-dependent flavin oxidoreductase YrpB (nitropropane dioxygenase family)